MANKRRKISGKKRRRNSSRRWEDLDSDLLKKIFEGLRLEILIVNVSSVCRWWKQVCWDVLFWKGDETLDLSPLKNFIDYLELWEPMRAMKFLKRVVMKEDKNGEVDERCRSITTLVFPPNLRLYDRHLAYVSERLPGLKKLNFRGQKKITGKGFSRTIRNWRALEEIYIGRLAEQHYTHIIQEMGINCKNLKALHLCSNPNEKNWRYNSLGGYYELDEYTSLTIIDNLPTLKVLELQDSYIIELGLKTILMKHHQLEKIVLTSCFRAERFGPLLRQVNREVVKRRLGQGKLLDMLVFNLKMEKNIGKNGHITWRINAPESMMSHEAIPYLRGKISEWMDAPQELLA